MIGILVQLVISWLLLWFFQGKHISVLGLMPTRNRTQTLAVGFAVASACCAVYHLGFSVFAGSVWLLNKAATVGGFLATLWWTIKSVLFEELLFRGALLYIAIKRIGDTKACLLSAACFGVYHWFSYGAFGNPMQMIFVFLLTAVMGSALAYAFARTGSLYLPVGVHAGWNLVSGAVFSNGPLGRQIFILDNARQLPAVESLIVFLFQLLALPLFVSWYSRRKTAR